MSTPPGILRPARLDTGASASDGSISSSIRSVDSADDGFESERREEPRDLPTSRMERATFKHPLVSPYHAPGRKSVMKAGSSGSGSSSASAHAVAGISSAVSAASTGAASSDGSFSSAEMLPLPLVRTPSMLGEELESELFDWSGALPRVPFFEDAEANVAAMVANPPTLERFVWIGLSCCADALLYCFSFLPVKVLIALVGWASLRVKRLCSRRGSTPPPPLQAKHLHALLQGAIILFGLLGVSLMVEWVNLNTYRTISRITFVKLYVLFNLFALFDLILERIGKRLTGALHWSVMLGSSGQRVYIVLASSLYVLLHCIVLTCQISTLHSAIDQGAEVLGVLINVKLSDLKEGFRVLDREALFKLSLQDVANRFKWAAFLVAVGVQKIGRLYALPAVADLQAVGATRALVREWATWAAQAVTNGKGVRTVLSGEWWASLALETGSWARDWAYAIGLGLFSPALGTALSADSVYVTPALRVVAAQTSRSPFQLFYSKPPQVAQVVAQVIANATAAAGNSTAPSLSGELEDNPSLLLVDALSILPLWLPSFLCSCILTLVSLMVIDWIKHASLGLFNDFVNPGLYDSYARRLSGFFHLAPKVGLGDQKSSSFALAHFDFISLPLTVILAREVWSASVAAANSCAWGSLWIGALGKNVILDRSIRERCAVFLQQSAWAAQGDSGLGHTPSLAAVSPALRHAWLDGDPQQHFALAAGLLLAMRVSLFVFVCAAKILVRLCLRLVAKRHHRLEADAGAVVNPTPSPAASPSRKKDIETTWASPSPVAAQQPPQLQQGKKRSKKRVQIQAQPDDLPKAASILPSPDFSPHSASDSDSAASPPRPSHATLLASNARGRLLSRRRDLALPAAAASDVSSASASVAELVDAPELDRRKSLSLFAILKGALKIK